MPLRPGRTHVAIESITKSHFLRQADRRGGVRLPPVDGQRALVQRPACLILIHLEISPVALETQTILTALQGVLD
jgi:hypothetical protein